MRKAINVQPFDTCGYFEISLCSDYSVVSNLIDLLVPLMRACFAVLYLKILVELKALADIWKQQQFIFIKEYPRHSLQNEYQYI